MLGEKHKALDDFELYKDEKFISKMQNIKRDYRNLIDKSSDIESYTRDNLSK